MISSTKIIIVNPFGIGDVLFSMPLVEALKKISPGGSIGYICNKRAYEVIRSNPHIDKIFVYEKDDFRCSWKASKISCLKRAYELLRAIKMERYDIAIDLSLAYQYSLLFKMINIRRRIGLNYRSRGRFLTDKIDIQGFEGKHVVEYYLDVLKLIGVDPASYRSRPKAYVTERDTLWADSFLKINGISGGDAVIGVIPGCGASWGADAKYRRWTREGFAKVCDQLMKRPGTKVILFGDLKDLEICEEIVRLMESAPIVACGKTSLRDFLGLVGRCQLIITNDGGPLHMAVACGVNTVSIFGPVDAAIYGPYPIDGDHTVVSKTDVPCRPCYRRFKYTFCEDRRCLDTITPGEVIAAAEAMLRRNKAVHA